MPRWILLLLLAAPLVGCPTSTSGGDDDDSAGDDDDATEPMDFRVWSPTFVEPYFDVPPERQDCEEALPVENACQGPSPEVLWEGVPEGTESFVLIMDDPSFNPNQPFGHWAIYNIPATEDGLDAGISHDGDSNLPGGADELDNDFNFPGYLGSCTPPGYVNYYRWRLYALNTTITSTPSSFSELAGIAASNAIEVVEMCNLFDGDNRP